MDKGCKDTVCNKIFRTATASDESKAWMMPPSFSEVTNGKRWFFLCNIIDCQELHDHFLSHFNVVKAKEKSPAIDVSDQHHQRQVGDRQTDTCLKLISGSTAIARFLWRIKKINCLTPAANCIIGSRSKKAITLARGVREVSESDKTATLTH